MTADGEHDDDAPRRLRFVDRLWFHAEPTSGWGAFYGPRDFPLGEMLWLRRSEARNAHRRAVEARRRPGVVGRTRAARLRRR